MFLKENHFIQAGLLFLRNSYGGILLLKTFIIEEIFD